MWERKGVQAGCGFSYSRLADEDLKLSSRLQSQITGTSFLYTYPFWIFVKSKSLPQAKDIVFKGISVRIYPPFRSGPAKFIPMPYVDMSRIPFLVGTKVHTRKNLVVPYGTFVPQLGRDAKGEGRGILVGSPDWKDLAAVEDFPKDSLRIDVFDVSDQVAVKAISDKAATHLLQMLRWRSKQWWIGRSVDALLSFIRNHFPVSQDSAFLDRISGLVQFRYAIAGDEQPIDDLLWQACIESLGKGIEAPIYDLILLDSRYFANIGDVRRSVLDSAMGCEQAKNLTFERLWVTHKGKKFKMRHVFKGNVNLPDHLSAVMEVHFSRSYKKENPTDFYMIENLWLARGNIAHGGREEYWRDGKKIVIGVDHALEFAQAAQHCVQWLSTL